jgi:hypothetical protein
MYRPACPARQATQDLPGVIRELLCALLVMTIADRDEERAVDEHHPSAVFRDAAMLDVDEADNADVRSVRSARPSGRNAIADGTSMWSAMTSAARALPAGTRDGAT